MNEDYTAALHEAAHAIVCSALGGFVAEMSIREGSGAIRFALPATDGQIPAAAVAAVHLAGALAEEKLGTPNAASAADRQRAAACGFDAKQLREIEEQVIDILATRWSEVRQLAGELLRRRSISGTETMKLIEQGQQPKR